MLRQEGENKEIRQMAAGEWFWMDKAIIREYAPKIKFTGIAVYSFLASLADQSQSCFPSQKYIAEYLSISRTTVNRSIKRLSDNGLIKIEKRSRYHCIYHLLKVRCITSETQMYKKRTSDVSEMNINKNHLTRNINNIDNKINFLRTTTPASKWFIPQSREELLAKDLAEALNDRPGLPLYLSYAHKYSEFFLRRILGETQEFPGYNIKKGRAALFVNLVEKHVQNIHNHPGNKPGNPVSGDRRLPGSGTGGVGSESDPRKDLTSKAGEG